MSGISQLSAQDWIFVGLMGAAAFVAALLGSLIAFKNRFVGAIIAGILFAAGFVAWNYYPHTFGLPIVKTIGPDAAVTPASATPAAAAPTSAAPAPAAPAAPAPTAPAPTGTK
jgi:hypothetical protein